MRFYKTSDIDFYVNVRNKWDAYCRYSPNKTWAKKKPKQVLPKVWNVFSDLEGARKRFIEEEDLWFKCWPESRIDPIACLPLLYAVGNRFIKIEQAGPVGYKCSPYTMNLREARAKKAEMRAERRRKRREAWFRKWMQYECYKKKEHLRSR